MLTPDEISARDFLVSLRGFDREEVRAFLAQVAEQVRGLQARVRELEAAAAAAAAAAAQREEEAGTTAQREEAAHEPASESSALFAQISQETQRILEAAQAAGDELQRKARQEADRQLQQARNHAAKLIAEGERRRERTERVVGDLEAARTALADDLRRVGRTLEGLLRDLAPAPEPATTVREALAADLHAGARSAEEGVGGAHETGASDAASAPDGDEASEARGVASEAGGVASEAGGVASGAGAVASEAGAKASEAGGEEPPAAEEEAEPLRTSAREPGGQAEAQEPEQVDAQPPQHAEAARTPSSPARHAEVQVPPSESPVQLQPAQAPGPLDAVDRAAADASDPLALRAAALGPLHPKLTRRIKRGLQELHNATLDRLRRSGGRGQSNDFLPDEVELGELAMHVEPLLSQAYEAGVAAAGLLVGRDLPPPPPHRDLVGAFAGEAEDRLRSGVAATLRMGLSGGEQLPSLNDRVNGVFAELKGAGSEELAATHLMRSYELGLLDAWTAAGVEARRWVLGKEPRCPEARCRGNDQVGWLAVGKGFPSGHDTPPVHPGCTCTTVPGT